MYATTKVFLDYFNLKSLEELPSLAEIRDLDTINPELDFSGPAPGASILGLDQVPGEPQSTDQAEAGTEAVKVAKKEAQAVVAAEGMAADDENKHQLPSNVFELPIT
jgi:segregation and condensation protein B